MKKSLTLFWLFCLITFALQAQDLDFAWAKAFTNGMSNFAEKVALDGSGNVYITGRFNGIVDFDPGIETFNLFSIASDPYIAKLDGGGNFVWAVSFAGNSPINSGRAITTDNQNNVYIAGFFTDTVDFDPGPEVYNLTSVTPGIRSAFVCKLSSSGNFVWAKSFGGNDGLTTTGVAIDGTGSVYVSGKFLGTTDFNPDGSAVYNLTATPGDDDAYVLKLDASGNFVWAKKLGGAGEDDARGIGVDANNNVYVTGFFTGTVDFDPNPNTTFNLTSAGDTDAYVWKLSSDGNLVWAKAFGGPGNDYSQDIYIDAAGTSYTCGAFSQTADFNPDAVEVSSLTSAGERDVFICKLDASGNFVWAKSMGGTGYDESKGIKADANGNVYIAGFFYNSNNFDANPDIAVVYELIGIPGSNTYICKLDANGVFVEAACIPGTSTHDIALDAGANTYTCGTFSGTKDFNPHPTNTFNITASGICGFVLRLGNAPTGIQANHDLPAPILFPNPARDWLTINWSEQQIESIYFTDMQGRLFKTVSTPSADKQRLSIQDLPAGFYVVHVYSQGNSYQVKLVKE